MAKASNTVLSQTAGLLAVVATRHLTETGAPLEKSSCDFRHAYEPRNFVLERVIITSIDEFGVPSTKDDEKRVEVKGEVLFRSIFTLDSTVRVELQVNILMEGEDVIEYKETIVDTYPDIALHVSLSAPMALLGA